MFSNLKYICCNGKFKQFRTTLFLLFIFYIYYVFLNVIGVSYFFKKVIDGLVLHSKSLTLKYSICYFFSQWCLIQFLSISKFLEFYSLDKIEKIIRINIGKNTDKKINSKRISLYCNAFMDSIKKLVFNFGINFCLMAILINVILYYYNIMLCVLFDLWLFIYVFIIVNITNRAGNYKVKDNKKSNSFLADKKNTYTRTVIISSSKDVIILIINILISIVSLKMYFSKVIDVSQFCFIIQLMLNFQLLNKTITDDYLSFKKDLSLSKYCKELLEK